MNNKIIIDNHERQGVAVMYERIDHLKKSLDQFKPLPTALVINLEKVYHVEWTYHSNAIEGNTLNLLETKMVLEEG
jgi:hypothetical protein